MSPYQTTDRDLDDAAQTVRELVNDAERTDDLGYDQVTEVDFADPGEGTFTMTGPDGTVFIVKVARFE